MAERHYRSTPTDIFTSPRFLRMSRAAREVHLLLRLVVDLHGRGVADPWALSINSAFVGISEAEIVAAIEENERAGWVCRYVAQGELLLWFPDTDRMYEAGYLRSKRGQSSYPTPPGYSEPNQSHTYSVVSEPYHTQSAESVRSQSGVTAESVRSQSGRTPPTLLNCTQLNSSILNSERTPEQSFRVCSLDELKQVIDTHSELFLSGRRVPTTLEDQELIRARLSEGFTLEDLCDSLRGHATRAFRRGNGAARLSTLLKSADSVREGLGYFSGALKDSEKKGAINEGHSFPGEAVPYTPPGTYPLMEPREDGQPF